VQLSGGKLAADGVLSRHAGAGPDGGPGCHVADAMEEWGIDATRAERLNHSRFKRLLCRTLPCVLECRLVKERAQKPALDAYMSRSGDGPVAFDHAKAYLTGAGACSRGNELVLQLRTGSLPLASHTGKFSRSWR
jgi:hypothetical protein